jgi:hypothetical protein
MEALIIHCHTIFDEQLPTASYASSPPLPPAPLGETVLPYAYGSTHTKFSEYGSQTQFDAPLPQTPTSQTTGDDFTPQLPPQPPASIHPSSRGNTGSSSGHSNASPILTEAEANVSSPTSFIPPPPLPLRPGKQGSLTPIQSLRGTQGLDFPQREISEGDWTGPPPASPPLSDPPSPPPPTFKPIQIPFPPSALPHSTPPQQQPVLIQALTQEQPQPKAQPPLLAAERPATGGLESAATPLEASLNSTVDSGHPTDYSSHFAPDPPGGPALQPVTSRPPSQQVHQVPIQVTEAPDQPERPPVHSLRQPGEVPQGKRESQDEAPPSLSK